MEFSFSSENLFFELLLGLEKCSPIETNIAYITNYRVSFEFLHENFSLSNLKIFLKFLYEFSQISPKLHYNFPETCLKLFQILFGNFF